MKISEIEENWRIIEIADGAIKGKMIERFSTYIIRCDGNIYHRIKKRNLTSKRKGYEQVKMVDDDGNVYVFYVHALIARCFIGVIP